jgi:cellobiose-specific phosphotransferase system component IIB
MSEHGGFLAHWRAGSGGQLWRTGMSIDDLKRHSKENFDNGLRIESIDVFRFSDVPRRYSYTAVWRPGTGGQWWRSGMDTSTFKQEVEAQEKQGRLIYTLDRNDQHHIIAVFRTGSGGQWWRSGMSWNEFKKQDAQHFANGFRVQVLKRYRRNNTTKYMAVWRSGSGAQICRGGMSSSTFADWANTHAKEGLRLHWVDKSFHDGKWTAVWRPGTGREWIKMAVRRSDFNVIDKDFFDNNYRLETLRRIRMAAAPKTGNDSDFVQLQRQQVHEGNRPFTARFPAIGTINGTLQGITNASHTATLGFIKPGNTTDDCTKSSSIVLLKPQQKMTLKQVEDIYGTSRPNLPIFFVACVSGTSAASVPIKIDFHRR